MNGTKPLYLLSGDSYHHRKSRDPLIGAALRETGRAHPRVAYVGAASSDDPGFFEILRRLFLRSGAGAVAMAPLAGPDAAPAVAHACIEQADLIFLTEGDVDLGMRLLEQHAIPPLLRRRHAEGAVLAGFSAGSIMLARQWVRWRDPDDDATAEAFQGVGLAPLICDTHGEADGWAELKTLLSLRRQPDEIGYGIPTSMGLRAHPDGRIEAIGGHVHRYTFRDGRVDNIGDISPAFFVHASEYEYQI